MQQENNSNTYFCGVGSFLTSKNNWCRPGLKNNTGGDFSSIQTIFDESCTGVCESTIARKFDAKACFEVWSTAFYVVFREESEFEVKNSPEPQKNSLRKYVGVFEIVDNKKSKMFKNLKSPFFANTNMLA